MNNASKRGIQCGFTLTELITIMVIAGILAAVALPRFFDANVFQERGTADQVVAALRYGQKVAIAQHRNVTVNISAAANPNCGAVLTGGNVDCKVSDKVAFTPALPQAVTFDRGGRPVPNAAVSITAGTIPISVELETGYVH